RSASAGRRRGCPRSCEPRGGPDHLVSARSPAAPPTRASGSGPVSVPPPALDRAAGGGQIGLDALYGARLAGVPVTIVDADLAPMLAAAHRRVHRRPAGVVCPDGTVVDEQGQAPVPVPVE